MHALYVLAALDRLTAPVVLAALDDAHPRVREHAVRLAERLADDQRGRGEALRHDRRCRSPGSAINWHFRWEKFDAPIAMRPWPDWLAAMAPNR